MAETVTPLVLSLFPGIGLLDMAFEEEGFCVVRGHDRLVQQHKRSVGEQCLQSRRRDARRPQGR